MIPFRIGDPVKVEAETTWFAGAIGHIEQIYDESGTIMVKLERWGEDGPRVNLVPATLPFAVSELAPTRCQHPLVNESILRGWLVRQHWQEDPPLCPDCHEHLYPALLDDNSLRVYAGEPPEAGE